MPQRAIHSGQFTEAHTAPVPNVPFHFRHRHCRCHVDRPEPCRLVLPPGSDRFDRRRQPEMLLHIRPLGPEKLPMLLSEARVSSCLIWSLKVWSQGPAGTFSSGNVGGCRPPCRQVTSVCSMWCAPTLPEARTDRGWPVSVRPWSWKERGAVLCRRGGVAPAWLPVGLSQATSRYRS